MAQSDEATINAKEETSTNLCSAQKLDCDESLVSLQHFISTGNEKEILTLYNSFLDLAQSPDAPWESKHGALMGIRTIISNKGILNMFDIQSQSQDVIEVALNLLVHPEIRVRLSAGEQIPKIASSLFPCCAYQSHFGCFSINQENYWVPYVLIWDLMCMRAVRVDCWSSYRRLSAVKLSLTQMFQNLKVSLEAQNRKYKKLRNCWSLLDAREGSALLWNHLNLKG